MVNMHRAGCTVQDASVESHAACAMVKGKEKSCQQHAQ